MMTGAERRRFTALICAVISLGPVGIAAILPALPGAMRDIGGGVGSIQLSIAAFILGVSIAQLVFGPVSDRIGRRPPLLFGIAVYAIALFGILLVTTFTEFIALRFVQGLASASFFILTRSIIRDVFDREQAAKTYGLAIFTTGAATALSPILGGWLTDNYGWTSAFLVLGAYATIVFLAVIIAFPETLKTKNSTATKIGPFFVSARTIVQNRTFLAFLALQLSLVGGLNAFIVGSAPAFMNYLGQSSTEYALTAGIVFGMAMVGGIIVNRVVIRVGMIPVLMAGATIVAVAGITGIGIGILGNITVIGLALPMGIYMLGVSLASPNSQAGAMSPFPDKAGTASSVLGFLQQMSNALLSLLLGVVANGTPFPMIIAIGLCGVCALLAFIFLVRPISNEFNMPKRNN